MKKSFVDTEEGAEKPKKRSELNSRDTSLKSNHSSPEKPIQSNKTSAVGSKLRLLKNDKVRNTGSPVPMSQIRNGKVCIKQQMKLNHFSLYATNHFPSFYRLIRIKSPNR